MNFLEKTSLKSQKSSPYLRLVINTFTGNERESLHSEELKRILKSKNYKLTELIDINQELIFEKDKKISCNIREQFHKKKVLYKLNSKFSLPQINIGDELVLSYAEFELLNESGLFDKIMNGSICNHIRIFNNEVVYSGSALDEFSYCIYCYSLKKKKQVITLITNLRDNKDEENNEILSFCEGCNLTVKLIDYDNCFIEEIGIKELCERREKAFVVDQEVYPISEFFKIFDKVILRNMLNLTCAKCGKKVSSYINNLLCISCLIRDEEEGDTCFISDNKKNSITSIRRANKSYHFVEKLRLKQSAQMINVNLINAVPNLLNSFNISFRK